MSISPSVFRFLSVEVDDWEMVPKKSKKHDCMIYIYVCVCVKLCHLVVRATDCRLWEPSNSWVQIHENAMDISGLPWTKRRIGDSASKVQLFHAMGCGATKPGAVVPEAWEKVVTTKPGADGDAGNEGSELWLLFS